MRFKSLSTLAALALLPFLAQAGGLSYSYVEGAYINTDVDQFDGEIDGFALRGSFEVTDHVFLFAGYDSQTTSFFGIDVDLDRFNGGGGYAWSIGPSADIYGKFAYLQEEVGAGGVDADNYGCLLGIGLRGRVARQFELEGGLNYVELLFSGVGTSAAIGARWYFTDQFTAGVEGEFGDVSSTYGIGVRWDFGQ